ncbi:hypothetical protein [Nocardiopsis composta]|uniref:Uncharacterized protein n=1 Tax=Nocardiopsis composta TaxID=157465 RepID=A0A7W8VDW2_9ACTN|nr:hypothetical protein [Nocardiopsis composta]
MTNSVEHNAGTVNQVGIVEGGLRTEVYNFRSEVYNIFRWDGGAEIAHAPRRVSALAVLRPDLEGPEMRSRYELLWNRKAADPDRVHALNLYGRKGGWSGEYARRLCHTFQEKLPEVDPVVRAIDLDRFPGRMGAQELLRDLGVPEVYTVNDPAAVLEKAVEGLAPMALLLENGDRIGAVEPLLSAPPGSLIVITSERPLDWLGDLRRDWNVAEPLPAGPVSKQDARGLLWQKLAVLRPFRMPSDDEIERLFAEETAREADAIGYTAAAITFGKGNKSMAGTPDAAYALLPEKDQELVRYLGHCPEGMGVLAAAVLTGRYKDVGQSLEDLVRYGLAERDDTGAHPEPRYRLTAAAAERASGRWAAAKAGEDQADLAKAVCEVYHSLVLDAHLAVMPQRPLVSEERTEQQHPMTKKEALAWLRSERHALGESVKLAVDLWETPGSPGGSARRCGRCTSPIPSTSRCAGRTAGPWPLLPRTSAPTCSSGRRSTLRRSAARWRPPAMRNPGSRRRRSTGTRPSRTPTARPRNTDRGPGWPSSSGPRPGSTGPKRTWPARSRWTRQETRPVPGKSGRGRSPCSGRRWPSRMKQGTCARSSCSGRSWPAACGRWATRPGNGRN